MSNQVVSFKDEQGKSVKYEIRDQLLVNGREYILMSPEEDKSEVSVYKLSFNNGQEELDLIENEKEVTMIKSVSKKI
ncbi:MAG: DUF1292 domain-containing protein [Clostridiaceae bacterium]